MNLKNIKISTQLKISFIIMLLFVILLGWLSYSQSSEIHKQTETMYEHPLKTRRALEQLKTSILFMRMNIRDFLLAEDPKDRQNILNEMAINQAAVPREIENLKHCYLGPRKDIDDLFMEFTKWVSIREETVRMVNAGKIEEAKLRHKSGGVAPSQAKNVLCAIEKISDFALNKGNELFNNSNILSNSLKIQLLFTLGAILLLTFLINYILLRNIRKPITELTSATNNFQQGNMDARSSYHSKNEFGILSNSFNNLATKIQSATEISQRTAKISSLMLSEDEAKKFFQVILSELILQTESSIAAAYLLDDEKMSFEHFSSIGLDNSARQSFSATSFEGEFGIAISSKKIQHLKTISEKTIFSFYTTSGKFIPCEIITIPIISISDVVAVISLASMNHFKDSSIHFIHAIHDTLNARIEGILNYDKNKRISDQLAQTSFYTRGLIEASIDPLVTIGPSGKITDVNNSTETITGYTREELVGTDFAKYFTEPEKAEAGYQQVFREGIVRDYELFLKHKNGNITPVLYNASVYRNEEGKIIGVFAAARDITEQKIAEEKLQKLNDDLIKKSDTLSKANIELESQKSEMAFQSAELLEQNTELEMQKKQLNEASRLKTNFLSNMSHELRTPLNSVIALSGVLNRRLAKQIPEEEYSYLEVIERNGKHLLSLINDILDISRIEAGREEIEITKFNVTTQIEDVIKMINPQAKQKNINLIHIKPAKEITATSDSGKLRHILQNVIGNAVKFTQIGKVEITTEISNEQFVITVTDTGIGIAEENLARIFEEFRQADGSTSRRFGGTGLGLAIAKKYTNLLGGTITVTSELDKGSKFVISLPANYSPDKRIIEEEESYEIKYEIKQNPAATTNTKTILLVEDSEPAIIQMKDVLEESGYYLLIARNGAEALSIIEQTIPDAMILDLMMPGVDGFDVLKSLREAEKTAHIPVLILTAKHITKEELKFLKQNNVHQLIQKGDINLQDLLTAISKMVYFEKVKSPKTEIKREQLTGKPTVLVVEDNADNLITVKAILGKQYTVIEASDGLEGIEMAKKHIPNLILMDIALPGIDGIEAFKIIRNNATTQNIPIIALTASAMIHDRESILAHGFDSYISKPIDEKTFFKTIKEILYGE